MGLLGYILPSLILTLHITDWCTLVCGGLDNSSKGEGLRRD